MVHSLCQEIIKLKHRKRLCKKYQNNYARKLRRQRVFDYFRRELKGSSTHGVPYTVNEKLHWFERLFWAVSFLSCLFLVFYLLAAQFARFIETPTVISVEMDYFNWNVSYPAITLCADHNFKINAEGFSAILNVTKAKTKENVDSYLWSIATASLESLELIKLRDLSLIDPKNYTSIATALFKPFDHSSLTTNNNWPISVEAAMTELGMCYVLNSNVAAFDNPLKWTNSMMTYARNNIELSIHDRDFFTQVMNYAKIYKVFIHSPDEIILITTSSYMQDLEGFISLGVQVWTTRISEDLRALPIRIRKCRFTNEPISKRFKVYSYNHCLLECRIQMIIKLCGCIPHFYKAMGGERICNLDEIKCVLIHKREIASLSSSETILNRFKNTKGLPKSSRDCNCLSGCETDIYQKDYESFIPESNMNRLRVGISTFPKVRVMRDIMFSFQDIVLKVGGVLNLCVGASVLSIMEFFTPIIMIPIYFVMKRLKGLCRTTE